MVFMWILSGVALIVQLCFATGALASALYFLAELIEEYPVRAERVIRYISYTNLGLYACLLVFERFPILLVACGVLAHGLYLHMLRKFPSLNLDPLTIVALLLFAFVNYQGVSFFSQSFADSIYSHGQRTSSYTVMDAVSYFTVCVWLVPLALFLSLSANDHILPTRMESTAYNSGVSEFPNGVANRRRRQRGGFLQVFDYIKENYLPMMPGQSHRRY